MSGKIGLLYLCTGNSCRSQMAEGWTRALKGDVFQVYSAGLETHGLNPYAVRVMGEVGCDIQNQKSQHIDEFKDVDLGIVITVCGHAYETCPGFSAKCRVIHVGFDDPPALCPADAPENVKLEVFRRVRDEIKAFVETLPGSLNL